MKHQLSAVAIAALLCCPGTAQAAPLEFRNRPAEEAMQILRDHGLLEGYDKGGQLKGDRAISRWEMAMIMARFLNLADSRMANLLSRSEKETVERAARALEPELAQLGVRLQALEGKMEELDQRVQERERIRFKGQLISFYNNMHFYNRGNDTGGPGGGGLNYGTVGSLATSNVVPHAPTGIIPSLDLVRGRPLINGSGYSSTLYLEVETEPTPEWLVSARFYAYNSQGNSVVDQVWGAPPPYLSNSFTGQPNPNGQSISHAPFTNMGIDRVRILHEESGTTLTLGTYSPRYISPQIFVGQVNPRVGDPRFLECFGFQGTGEIKLGKGSTLGWEVLGTYLPDGNPVQAGLSPYRNEAYGGALSYKQRRFTAGLNFFRAASMASDGQALSTGLSNLVNGGTGQINVNWVNPPQYFSSNLATGASAGIGSTSDKRPLPGLANSDAGGPLASFGPQGITMGGAQIGYRADEWNLRGEFARSSYRPNRNSSYTSEGNLYGFGGGLEFLEGKLSFDIDYRHTDPTYDPMILVYPGTAAGVNPFRVYHRFPDFDQFWHLYSLHDTDAFPHNRQGLILAARWAYEDSSSLKLRYRTQTQVRTSLQDVRYKTNQLGAGIPNANVLGFSPGFFDPVFREYSPLSFDANLNPMEDQRGTVHAFGIDWHHQFGHGPFSVDVGYEQYKFSRPSNLAPTLGGSQNLVDLTASLGKARVGYRPNKTYEVGLGYEFGAQRGHYDPLGVYNPYAIAVGSTTFRNRDTFQSIPFVDLTLNLAENIKVDSNIRYYINTDRVPSNVFAGAPGGPASQAHPFNFDGYSFTTRLEINF